MIMTWAQRYGEWDGGTIKLKAPFAAPDFTLRINAQVQGPVSIQGRPLKRVRQLRDLEGHTMVTDQSGTLLCFDLKKGDTHATF
ncbi:MAG: hypothetical protein GY809_25975 [Planctomycetes bacterium]|nr:hypothetical protein [Planctomycetota bacterium]